jgi:VanZ family protein
MALIFVVSSIAVQLPGLRYFPLRDKGIHFLEYAVLGWLCAAASSRTASFAMFVAVLWGLSDEIHQAFVPGRSSELGDVVADAIGAFAGTVGWHRFSNPTVS